MEIYDLDNAVFNHSLVTRENTEQLLPGIKVVPCNITKILMGFRGLLYFQYSEDLGARITPAFLNHLMTWERWWWDSAFCILWSISDEFGLWGLKGHCGLYFLCSKRTQTRSSCIGLANNFVPIFPLNLIKSANELFGQPNTICAVASLFSNTSSLMLILFKNKWRFRNTDNGYQGHFSQPLPLCICDGHISCTL